MFFFYGEGLLSTSTNPQAGGPPLVGCPRLLIQFLTEKKLDYESFKKASDPDWSFCIAQDRDR